VGAVVAFVYWVRRSSTSVLDVRPTSFSNDSGRDRFSDRGCLRPTAFFTLADSGEDEVEDPTAAEGFQSLLEQMLGFMNPCALQWHYRSLDEALIAFSNRYIYNDSLAFPGVGGPPTFLTFLSLPSSVRMDKKKVRQRRCAK
jgi:hypothetical protein